MSSATMLLLDDIYSKISFVFKFFSCLSETCRVDVYLRHILHKIFYIPHYKIRSMAFKYYKMGSRQVDSLCLLVFYENRYNFLE